MTRPLRWTGVAALVLCCHVSARAYLPEGRDILNRMVEHLGLRQNLLVQQQLLLYNRGPEQAPVVLKETLRYRFPHGFRSETLSDPIQKIHLFSHGRAVTVIDQTVTSTSEGEVDHFKDVLLFNEPDLIWQRLSDLGVDADVSSLGRFDGRIGHVIGAKYPESSAPQLWVDKKTYRPWRFMIRSMQAESGDLLWEFRYLDWRQAKKGIRYPYRIEVYRGGRLQQVFQVLAVQADNALPGDLFDIQKLRSRYREMPSEAMEPDGTDELMELRKSVEDFRRMME
ncbi:MAG: hypothetical protein ACOZF0_18280 [Thermodesulfobacteriota bacterium]